jgi:hypothetical protein
MAAIPSAAPYRAPIWPVIVAPLVAIVYLAIKSAFAQSIVSVLGTATIDIDRFDPAAPQWGSHWLYRSVAEAVATGLAALVAAGLAHGRERLAAIVAGCSISAGFVVRIAILLYAWTYRGRADFGAPEPWYQYAIDAAMIIAAPMIGGAAAEAAKDLHRDQPNGFGGINRLHFLWLWIIAFWYALGLITPIWRIYAAELHGGLIAMVLSVIINGIAAAAVGVPGYFGLALLAGHRGAKSGEMSVSNALTALTKSNQLARREGKYHAA